MKTKIELNEEEIKQAIRLWCAKKLATSFDLGQARVYLHYDGGGDNGDPREHPYFYAECEVSLS